MSGMTFLSDPCYLPIYRDDKLPGSIRFTEIWTNFVRHNANDIVPIWDIIKEYNGTLLKDVVIFDTEQDKMWFILKWS